MKKWAAWSLVFGVFFAAAPNSVVFADEINSSIPAKKLQIQQQKDSCKNNS